MVTPKPSNWLDCFWLLVIRFYPIKFQHSMMFSMALCGVITEARYLRMSLKTIYSIEMTNFGLSDCFMHFNISFSLIGLTSSNFDAIKTQAAAIPSSCTSLSKPIIKSLWNWVSRHMSKYAKANACVERYI